VLTEGYSIDYFGGAAGGAILGTLQESPVKDWYAWLELGCFYYEARSFDAAEAAFTKSLSCCENPLATAAMAKLLAAKGRGAEGVPMMKRAVALCGQMGGEYVRLVIEAAAFVKAHGTVDDTSERLRKLRRAAAYLRLARSLVSEAVENTPAAGRTDFSSEMIERILRDRDEPGSLRNLEADLKDEGGPLWTRPLDSPKRPNKKDM
jgi:hypothetical protein